MPRTPGYFYHEQRHRSGETMRRLRDVPDRRNARGKSRMAALCVVMRNLLMIAYGVLKSRQKFTLNIA